ncbi:nucleotide pyrophosphohydrolase [Haloarcula sp. 1CSR25-25]|uniref:nucleotide pyrophosphohydrolase n=1 Tax=Haloarcula sp. 1CSR25-25 TaxID=2862545 RepID=UPI0028959321|nr:nucleotide pyrophosphohydrolase [Haloarcula sp. 1CSR25-25]MDT3434669.1 nucleotide pyrophosphohydrolase [Haloarcula sp. 1CSR25-25]
MADDLSNLRDRYHQFVHDRDWQQFHTPKSTSMALSVEAAELMELFQWHDNISAERVSEDEKLVAAAEDELADILIYCLSMADQLDTNLEEVIERKLEENERRFDEETAAEITANLERWQRTE